MNLSGGYRLPASPDRAYSLLQDPVVLARCMPGCERLDWIAENEYAMRMKMMLASVSGLFDGKVRLADQIPRSFRLIVEGSGKIGFMKGDGRLTVAPDGDGSSIAFDGEVHVGGTIANVGQRLMDMTARMLINRFFAKLAAEAAAEPAVDSSSVSSG